jgi:uncharacterized membrane protein
MTNNKIFSYIKVLALAGVLVAVYLLWEQIFHPSLQFCNINSTVNCDAIISGKVSRTLGLPTPLYGLIGYVVIFLSSIFQRKKLLLGTATFGLLFCFWIAYQELFLLHVICPACILCQLLMIAIFILAFVVDRGKNDQVTSPK